MTFKPYLKKKPIKCILFPFQDEEMVSVFPLHQIVKKSQWRKSYLIKMNVETYIHTFPSLFKCVFVFLIYTLRLYRVLILKQCFFFTQMVAVYQNSFHFPTSTGSLLEMNTFSSWRSCESTVLKNALCSLSRYFCLCLRFITSVSFSLTSHSYCWINTIFLILLLCHLLLPSQLFLLGNY